MPTTHIIITGKVQGVFFRATTKETADKLGVSGWVKNTPEGNVEVMITGSEAQTKEFVNWCRKGPANAKVESMCVSVTDQASFPDFKIKR